MPDTLVAAPPRGREPLAYPAGGVDGLLRRAARRWPGRTAIRTTSGAPDRAGTAGAPDRAGTAGAPDRAGTAGAPDRAGTAGAPDRAGTCGQPAPGRVGTAAVTFATLDAWADRCAWAVRGLVGTGAVCGLATVLDPEFAAAFHGVCRSGNAVVSLNPLHPPAVLARALRTAGARVAFVTADMYAKLAGLEGPPLVVIGPAPDGVPKLWELADAATPAALPEPDGDDLACIHFTSGTTGEPKGVRLSHRNLVVNAMQTAQAHGLDDHSVVLNHLPAYPLMHLGAALHAGAAQVLCTVVDPLDSLHAARRVRATHYYGLPFRLARLAADPRLADLAPVPSLRGLFSGGSALPAGAAAALRARLGIPVVQGYGLAETSSMCHLDRPDGPKPGSVGVPAADTACRIVDVRTREPLPPGRPGEIEVRGPQLMLGYLDGTSGLTDDGWLRTGDVGHVDDEGWLYLVDRLKDVFKCDHEMVSPSELERVLAAHPDVADCVVVDRPDPVHGAVAHALVALRPSAGSPAAAVTYANDRLADHQRIRSATVVDRVPRSPIGKIDRRALRARVREEGHVTWSL